MAEPLGGRVLLGHPVDEIEQAADAVVVRAPGLEVRARRAIMSLASALAGRVRYTPPSRRPGSPVSASADALGDQDSLRHRGAPRLFGDPARKPELYREKSWGEDPYCRGADGGYWSLRVWTTYGHAIREPHGRPLGGDRDLGGLERQDGGALLAGERAAADVLDRPG